MTSLLNLPALPLAHILSYLDEKSLREAQLVASPLLAASRNYRNKMATTKINDVHLRIVRSDPPLLSNVDCYLEMKIHKSKGCKWPRAIYFPHHVDDQARDRLIVRKQETNGISALQICTEMSFAEWITTYFVNVSCAKLEIIEFAITKHDVDHLEKCLWNRKTRVMKVEMTALSDYSQEYMDLMLRFASVFNMKKLSYQNYGDEGGELLLTDHLIEMLPLLDEFRHICPNNQPKVQLPDTFYKLPPSLIFIGAILVSISSLRMALQEWTHNRLRIERWAVMLPIEFADEDHLMAAIDLPFIPVSNQRHPSPARKYTLKNCLDQKLLAKSVNYSPFGGDNEDVSYWTFSVLNLNID